MKMNMMLCAKGLIFAHAIQRIRTLLLLAFVIIPRIVGNDQVVDCSASSLIVPLDGFYLSYATK